jgi:hypothetical protein
MRSRSDKANETTEEASWNDNMSSNCSTSCSFPPEIFQSDEDRDSKGEVLLNHDLLVSCQYGRSKKFAIILFERRLVILRRTASFAHVKYDIPVEHLLQVTHRYGEAGSAALTVFWDAEADGPHQVAGVELFFDGMDRMMLWARYLAQAVVQ